MLQNEGQRNNNFQFERVYTPKQQNPLFNKTEFSAVEEPSKKQKISLFDPKLSV